MANIITGKIVVWAKGTYTFDMFGDISNVSYVKIGNTTYEPKLQATISCGSTYKRYEYDYEIGLIDDTVINKNMFYECIHYETMILPNSITVLTP